MSKFREPLDRSGVLKIVYPLGYVETMVDVPAGLDGRELTGVTSFIRGLRHVMLADTSELNRIGRFDWVTTVEILLRHVSWSLGEELMNTSVVFWGLTDGEGEVFALGDGPDGGGRILINVPKSLDGALEAKLCRMLIAGLRQNRDIRMAKRSGAN